MSVLEVKSLTVSFPLSGEKDGEKKTVLEDIAFNLNKGEVLGLVGESGSGKSMTASAIARLLPKKAIVESGEVFFNGKDLLKISEKEMRKEYRGKRISTIFQDAKGSFSPVTPIGPQIEEMLTLHKGLRGKAARAAAIELLRQANISNPEESYGKIISRLSGGEAQRASIAMMALSTTPDILIADEATTALDVTVQKKTLDYLMTVVRDKGISLLFITHDFGLVAEYADRVVVLDAGKVVETGSVEKVFKSPESEFMKRVLSSLPRIDKPLREKTPENAFSESLIDVDDLDIEFVRHKSTGLFSREELRTRAVDSVSFNLHRGEMLGIVGESGSGKTTLMRAILGPDILPSSARKTGDVSVLGNNVYDMGYKELRDLRKSITGVPQSSKQSLTPRVRVRDLVGESFDIHKMYDSKSAQEKDAEKTERVAALLEAVELPLRRMRDFPARLSGGEQQRVAIASALATDPEVLILDEPTASLDASRKNTILELLIKLHQERNLSFIIISHELATVASICDRVLVMQRGRVVEEGSPEKVFRDPDHPYTQELIASIPVPEVKERKNRA
ncbi:MAG: ABC transporter ATP-binding protein [Candidatus Spechtbacterales bacterium]|nr:ABC transporter ATP-binding protein [Candidatus Spechtbacterales bacterium]